VLVHRVPAFHNPSLLARIEQILEANRAIMITGSLHALVLSFQFNAVAHGALVAMIETLASPDTAKPAFITMEYLLLFCCVVEEIAFVTKI
jgi:hypothetical protein